MSDKIVKLEAKSATFVVIDDQPAIYAATDRGPVFMRLTDETVVLLWEQMSSRLAVMLRKREPARG